MESDIKEIGETRFSTSDALFERFAELLGNYADRIVSHAIFTVSSRKIEGISNMMKSIRCSAYGYNDDEYLFKKPWINPAASTSKARNPTRFFSEAFLFRCLLSACRLLLNY